VALAEAVVVAEATQDVTAPRLLVQQELQVQEALAVLVALVEQAEQAEQAARAMVTMLKQADEAVLVDVAVPVAQDNQEQTALLTK